MDDKILAEREKRNKRIAKLIRRYCEQTNADYKNFNGEKRKKFRMDLWVNIIAPYVKSKISIDLIKMQEELKYKSCNLKTGSTLIYLVSSNEEKYRKVAKCITDLCNEKRIIFIDICDEYGGEPPMEKEEKRKQKELENTEAIKNIDKSIEDIKNENKKLKEEIKKCYTLIRLLNLDTYNWCNYRILTLLINKLANDISIKEFLDNDVDIENFEEMNNYAWSLFERELLIRQKINLKYRVAERGHGDIRNYIDFNELPFAISVIVGMLERRNFDCSEIIEKAKNHKYDKDISKFKYIYKH
mgnify:CR=1 FL=1